MTEEELQELVLDLRAISNILVRDSANQTDRIKELEEHDRAIQDIMTTSCSIKDKQIAEGDIKVFWKVVGIIGSFFVLFIATVGYSNNEHGTIHEKINVEAKATVKIQILTEIISARFDKFESKLEALAAHKHDRIDITRRVNNLESRVNKRGL